MENLEPKLTEINQDQIISLMIFDENFLSNLYRRKVTASIFESDVRKKTAALIFDYYTQYAKAPEENMISVLEKAKKEGTLRDDYDLVLAYLDKVLDIQISSKEFILDQLDDFLKKQIAMNTINTLIKLRERPYVPIDKIFETMQQAIFDTRTTLGKQPIELISQDADYDFKTKPLTRFGIKELDDQVIMGERTFGIILAYTNVGKSWALNHLAKMAVRMGNSCLYIPTEMNNMTCRLRFKMSLSGLGRTEIASNEKEVEEAVKEAMIKRAEIMLLTEEEKGMAVDELPRILKEAEERTGIKPRLILLDSAAEMMAPAGKYKDKLEASTATYTYLKNLAAQDDLCIITTHQATREGHDGGWLDAKHTSSDFNAIKKATLGISLNADEGEINKEMRRLYVFKHTDGRVGGRFWCRQDLSKGQFVMESGRWEKKGYLEMIKKM